MNSFSMHRYQRPQEDFYVDVESDLKPKNKENFVGRFISIKEKEENRKRGRPRKMRAEGFDKNISQTTEIFENQIANHYKQLMGNEEAKQAAKNNRIIEDTSEYESATQKKIKRSKLKYKKIISLGQINFNISQVQPETRVYYNIKIDYTQHTLNPQLLTLESIEKLDSFPSEIFTDLIVEYDMFSSSQMSLDYFSQCLNQSTFKYIIGWLYCPEFSQGKQLINFARKLKSSRKCLGAKFFDQTLGLTIMNNNVAVQKVFNQTTKWVVLEEYMSQDYMEQLMSFPNLEALQPGLIYILYTRLSDESENNRIDYQIINYLNVFKMRELEDVIESEKQKKFKQEEFDQQRTEQSEQKDQIDEVGEVGDEDLEQQQNNRAEDDFEVEEEEDLEQQRQTNGNKNDDSICQGQLEERQNQGNEDGMNRSNEIRVQNNENSQLNCDDQYQYEDTNNQNEKSNLNELDQENIRKEQDQNHNLMEEGE